MYRKEDEKEYLKGERIINGRSREERLQVSNQANAVIGNNVNTVETGKYRTEIRNTIVFKCKHFLRGRMAFEARNKATKKVLYLFCNKLIALISNKLCQ